MLSSMATSRKRRTRPHLTKAQRKQRRERGRGHSGRELVAALRPGENLEPYLTDEDRSAMAAEVAASARGDARAALEHHLSGLVVEESLHRFNLREIADLGEDAPGWLYSRWCVDQAYRWMLLNADPRTDDTIRMVLVATHLDQVDRLFDDPRAFTEYGTIVAVGDWLARQLCVYTSGGLLDFLDARAEPQLLARTDQVRAWAQAPLGVYRLEERRGSVLVLRDLVHDSQTEVMNLGAFNERDADHVLGRVVPISQPPFRMFDSRPVSLDQQTAVETAVAMRGPDPFGWLDALSLAREDGRLVRGFSCHQTTLFSSDLVPEFPTYDPRPTEPTPRMCELLDAGLSEYAVNGVMVAEVALIAATVSDESAAVVASHLSAVLVDSRIFAAVLTHCTAPEHEEAWRTLAACTVSPVRDRCREIAERCGPRAA